MGGDIHARRLYLQEIGGENILTYMDSDNKSRFNDNNNIYTSGDNEGETKVEPTYKLSGNYIEGRGLKAYDENNNLRVHIDGRNGSLEMYNGYIRMQNSNGNELYIDPENFIKWIINGEKKFYYDTAKDALVFGGLLKADSLAIVGVGTYNNDEDKTWFRIDRAGPTGDRIKFDAGSRTIEMRCGVLNVINFDENGREISSKVATHDWVTSQHYVTQDELDATIARYFPSDPHTPGGGDSGGDSGDSGGGTTTGFGS